MSHNQSDIPLLAELTDAERELAMERYEVIASLLPHKRLPKKVWQQAAQQGRCSIRTVQRWVKRFDEVAAWMVNVRHSRATTYRPRQGFYIQTSSASGN